ncbi:S24/S26 family peptidase [Xylanibacter muris]|uniref:S24/S26 family peptidase n=1 Tax=Xylanibacter muris TaxID=2736290 RepID=A0ABX2AM90_9BACT|nr:S24/S26 family peptidase [Xylanibacter muris]NPD92313.1 S24/S26 family peptidase [Xylanibacter muris]
MTYSIDIKHKKISNSRFLPEVIRMIGNGHSVTIPLKGYSMRPFLEDDRDKAILSKVRNLNIGDIALAEISPKTYVLHRIIGINGDNVVLRGDGNIACEHCRLSDIKAIATGFYRKGSNKPCLTSSRKWKAYSWIWTRLYPIRRYLLFIYRITL